MIVRAEHAQIRDYQTMINTVINMLSLHSNQWYKSLLSSENIHLQICQIVTLNKIICFSFRFWRWIISRIQSILKKDAVQHASSSEKRSSPSPPRFFRAALLASCPTLDSPSLGSSPSGSGWASWFSLLSPPSWLLSDFLSLLFSFSLREEGGFFPLLLRTFCCCWKTEKNNF